MGRIASTTRGMATAASDGGLLLAPATDLWGDWGLPPVSGKKSTRSDQSTRGPTESP